jgi:hypothetical protein
LIGWIERATDPRQAERINDTIERRDFSLAKVARDDGSWVDAIARKSTMIVESSGCCMLLGSGRIVVVVVVVVVVVTAGESLALGRAG